ncbi:hypothetical protein HBZC1_00210 [Helicobacter bizzozeronii CIII-1]|uniref:Uncharacterized protein n=1 Tax=Helicobacter bizzozeronii (strain CIII-1) TaxID=1002804 RepID=F8KQK3_HELBC|nr:hypothetical protein HBZC1_00210 [Helicobacter bizzozeronii CIII-1]
MHINSLRNRAIKATKIPAPSWLWSAYRSRLWALVFLGEKNDL